MKRSSAFLLVNLFILSIFVTTQNCGRASLTAPIPLEQADQESLAVSLSSELVVQAYINKEKIFSIPTNNSNNVQIKSLSFNPASEVLETKTSLSSAVRIDPVSWSVTYNPSVGIIGYDRTVLYVSGTDGSSIVLSVLFVVSSEDQDPTPDLNALVYGASDEDRIYLNNKLLGYAPPGMGEIFHKWSRFAGNQYYSLAKDIVTLPALNYCNSGVNLATGQFNSSIDPATKKTINPGTYEACVNNAQFAATSWVLLPNPDRIYCAANSGALTGFVSPLSFEYYKHSAIVTSKNSDDDTIGVVIAFVRDGAGTNHVLAAVRTQGGNRPAQGWAIVYYKNSSVVQVFGEKSVSGVNTNGTPGQGDRSGWSGRMSKIYVVREGDKISATASPWDLNEGALFPSDQSKIEINLADEKLGLKIFQGAKPYGYLSLSQLGSEYRGVDFITGANDTYVYDLPNKIVYEKQASGIFKMRKDLDAFTHIGAPRKVGNPDTGKIFQLNADKSFVLLH